MISQERKRTSHEEIRRIMSKWEYLTGMIPANKEVADERMDLVGAEGWELVSVIVVNGQVIAFFKRPVLDAVDHKDVE